MALTGGMIKNTAIKELRTKYTRELNQDMASEMASLVPENQRLRAIT